LIVLVGWRSYLNAVLYKLTFNGFQENTYILGNEAGQAVVIDPGMSDASECEEFDGFLRKHNLTLAACWLTHAHIDHVLGLGHIFETYNLQPRVHPGEKVVYEANPQVAAMYGMLLRELPQPVYDLKEGDAISFGELSLKLLLAPGHSPASVCFYCESEGFLVGGDVLFRDSIGRTDLPGGDHATLLNSIREQVYTLPKATVVWPGHGPETTVAYERVNNPFVRASDAV